MVTLAISVRTVETSEWVVEARKLATPSVKKRATRAVRVSLSSKRIFQSIISAATRPLRRPKQEGRRARAANSRRRARPRTRT